ncbi:hypothetical protein CF319_g8910 [Tilletia indica]|nr:hypothetical protein CF319_g8910 [Tilletia indica]
MSSAGPPSDLPLRSLSPAFNSFQDSIDSFYSQQEQQFRSILQMIEVLKAQEEAQATDGSIKSAPPTRPDTSPHIVCSSHSAISSSPAVDPEAPSDSGASHSPPTAVSVPPDSASVLTSPSGPVSASSSSISSASTSVSIPVSTPSEISSSALATVSSPASLTAQIGPCDTREPTSPPSTLRTPYGSIIEDLRARSMDVKHGHATTPAPASFATSSPFLDAHPDRSSEQTEWRTSPSTLVLANYQSCEPSSSSPHPGSTFPSSLTSRRSSSAPPFADRRLPSKTSASAPGQDAGSQDRALHPSGLRRNLKTQLDVPRVHSSGGRSRCPTAQSTPPTSCGRYPLASAELALRRVHEAWIAARSALSASPAAVSSTSHLSWSKTADVALARLQHSWFLLRRDICSVRPVAERCGRDSSHGIASPTRPPATSASPRWSENAGANDLRQSSLRVDVPPAGEAVVFTAAAPDNGPVRPFSTGSATTSPTLWVLGPASIPAVPVLGSIPRATPFFSVPLFPAWSFSHFSLLARALHDILPPFLPPQQSILARPFGSSLPPRLGAFPYTF